MILHLDLDSFFASAHRIKDKSLLNRPIAVGGRSNLKIFDRKKVGIRLYDTNSGAFVNPVFYSDVKDDFNSFFIDYIDGKRKIRGIITTASYEARECGVKTGMSISEALRLCPNLKVLIPNYLLYHKLSHELHSFLKLKIPKVEQFSIDEFFGDIGGWIDDANSLSFAQELQLDIKREFDLPISIGIAKSKWIAKLATSHAKPNGICFIPKDEIYKFIKDMPIEEFPGIGRGYKKRLKAQGILTLGDAIDRKELFYSWKKPGRVLYNRIIGEDNEEVSSKNDRKSIGISRTFDPISDRDEIKRRVRILSRHISYIVLKLGVNPTSYYMSLKYDFRYRVKGRKTVDRIYNEELVKQIFVEIFDEIDLKLGHIIKISMSVSNFSEHRLKTLSLIEIGSDLEKNRLSRSIQKMRDKYSLDIIKSANEL